MMKWHEAIVVVILLAFCAVGMWPNPAASFDGTEWATEQPAIQRGELESFNKATDAEVKELATGI